MSRSTKIQLSDIRLLPENTSFEPLHLDEKRRATRIEINKPVRYRLLDGKNNKWEEGMVVNISQKGLRLVLPMELPVGAEIELNLRLSEETKTLRLAGTVVWSEPSNDVSTQVHHGLNFQESKPYPGKERLVHFLADQMCRLATCGKLLFSTRPAETFEELKAAYALVYKEYIPRGYCMENPSGMHYHVSAMFPDSRTFLLEKKEQLLGTITLVPDSSGGLCVESIFPEEISKLRGEGKRLAEVCLLALSGNEFAKGMFSLTHVKKLLASFQLFRIMFDYARTQANITDLVIGVHPKHTELYRYLKFEQIGPVKSYQNACGNPAVLMRMDIKRIEKTVPTGQGVGSYFLRGGLADEILTKHYKWNSETVRHLLIEAQPIWPKLSNETQAYLKTCYPGF
ncbi:MAG: PilZ domain-containing protein [Candidatus Omnitrophica bacterium]|nr:PilZ domain-containing protein [Candidatus Omnitrophota bacterium]